MTPDAAISTTQDPALQPPSTAGMTTKVVKGSLWTLAGQVAPLAISLVTTPFTIRLLGAEGYGVLVLLVLIPTYFAFADLGMGLASVKFASEAYGTRDSHREVTAVHTAAVISMGFSIPIAALLFLFSTSIVGMFGVPYHVLTEASIALKIASVTFLLNFLNTIINSPQLARLRMDLNTFITSGFRMIGMIATPIALYFGAGIIGAVAILLVVALFTFLTNIIVSGRLVDAFLIPKFDRTAVRPMLAFGSAYAISNVAALLLGSAEKFILTRATSVKDLAYYSVAFTIATMLTMFSGSMTQSLVPAFSQMQSPEERERRSNTYSRCIRIVLIAFVPTLVFVAIIARPFLTLWAGEEFGLRSVGPLHILMVGLLINAVAFFPVAVIIASGRTGVLAKLYWIELVLYIPIAFWLVSNFGINGAAAAWSIRVIADAVILFFLAKRIGDVSIGSFSLKAVLGFAIVGVPFVLVQFLDVLTPTVVVVSLLAFISYAFLAWNGMLAADEIEWFKARVSALFVR